MNALSARCLRWLARKLFPYYEQEKHKQNLAQVSQIETVGANFYCESVIEYCGGQYMSFGDNVSFGHSLFLTAWDSYNNQRFTPSINIGSNCCFGAYNHITCINKISIGEGCLTGKWVTITDNSHGETDWNSLQERPIDRPLFSKGPVTIGKNVWIGDKATILPGVSIGDCVVIGANSVVTEDIPSYCIAVGSPARIIHKNEQA